MAFPLVQPARNPIPSLPPIRQEISQGRDENCHSEVRAELELPGVPEISLLRKRLLCMLNQAQQIIPDHSCTSYCPGLPGQAR